MLINVYLEWYGMNEIEYNKYDRGYYICEKKHYLISPSRYLFQECFTDNLPKKIPYRILKDRLPLTQKIIIDNIESQHFDIQIDNLLHILEEYITFVQMVEKKEKESGEYCSIRISFS